MPGLAGVRAGAAGNVRRRGREASRPAPPAARASPPRPAARRPTCAWDTEASPRRLSEGAKPGAPRPAFCVPEHPAGAGGAFKK